MREIDYSLTRSDYREFYGVSCARRLWKFCLVTGLLLTGLSVWSDYCSCSYLTLRGVLADAASGFGIAAAVSVGLLLLNVRYAARIYRAMEPIAKEQTIAWDGEAVRLGSRFYSATYPWSLFRGFRETKRVIAANLTAVSPLLLPKRSMTEEQINELREHLRSGNSLTKS